MYYTICWYKVDIQGRWLWHILYRWQIIQLYWFASILLNFWSVVITFNFILFSLDKDRLHTNIYQLSLILNLYSQNTKNVIFVFRDYFLENIESTFILLFITNYKSLGLYNTIYQQLFSKFVVFCLSLLLTEENQLTMVFEIVLWPRLIKIMLYYNIYMATLTFSAYAITILIK